LFEIILKNIIYKVYSYVMDVYCRHNYALKNMKPFFHNILSGCCLSDKNR